MVVGVFKPLVLQGLLKLDCIFSAQCVHRTFFI
jgi:hypothetical protein